MGSGFRRDAVQAALIATEDLVAASLPPGGRDVVMPLLEAAVQTFAPIAHRALEISGVSAAAGGGGLPTEPGDDRGFRLAMGSASRGRDVDREHDVAAACVALEGKAELDEGKSSLESLYELERRLDERLDARFDGVGAQVTSAQGMAARNGELLSLLLAPYVVISAGVLLLAEASGVDLADIGPRVINLF